MQAGHGCAKERWWKSMTPVFKPMDRQTDKESAIN